MKTDLISLNPLIPVICLCEQCILKAGDVIETSSGIYH